MPVVHGSLSFVRGPLPLVRRSLAARTRSLPVRTRFFPVHTRSSRSYAVRCRSYTVLLPLVHGSLPFVHGSLPFVRRSWPYAFSSLFSEIRPVRAGKCVVAGNVRRTAEIAFGDPSSTEYIELKGRYSRRLALQSYTHADWPAAAADYKVNPHRMEYGWTSNNSVYATLGMDYRKVCEKVQVNGEPGFAWLDNMQVRGCEVRIVQDSRGVPESHCCAVLGLRTDVRPPGLQGPQGGRGQSLLGANARVLRAVLPGMPVTECMNESRGHSAHFHVMAG
jgi:hypothetical protein